MKSDELILLPSDRQYIERRLAEIDAEILALGPEFQAAFSQTSETWHDNAPFEVVRDKQSNLSAERQSLKDVLRNSTLKQPSNKKDTVDTGRIVTIKDLKKDKVKSYFLAGDWTAFAGKPHTNSEATIISRRSPIGNTILGLKTGDKFSFRGGDFLIEGIE